MLCVNHQQTTLCSILVVPTDLKTCHLDFSPAHLVRLYCKEFMPNGRFLLYRNKTALKSIVTNSK
jgi:hypothetical protein